MPSTLIPRIQDLVREHYVFADVGESIAASMSGVGYDGADPAGTATALTAALQSLNGDRHLRVRHYPDGVPPEHDEASQRAYWVDHIRRHGGGIDEVRRLDDGVWLVGIGPIIPPAELAASRVQAAFVLLQEAHRIVLDLRGCIGGTPETVALICSYFTGAEPVHLQDVVSRDGTIRPSWTITSVGPKVDRDASLHVLVSAATFSGGEELAYDLQALGRATVVGEATGGGAHPREAFDLTDTLQLHVPVARSVNAVTGTNWEGIGVLPDVRCSADSALAVALGADAER
jgi:Peptidase family S41/N-terminal domain of Peptidase_S41 in eukaryotic IRBP